MATTSELDDQLLACFSRLRALELDGNETAAKLCRNRLDALLDLRLLEAKRTQPAMIHSGSGWTRVEP